MGFRQRAGIFLTGTFFLNIPAIHVLPDFCSFPQRNVADGWLCGNFSAPNP